MKDEFLFGLRLGWEMYKFNFLLVDLDDNLDDNLGA